MERDRKRLTKSDGEFGISILRFSNKNGESRSSGFNRRIENGDSFTVSWRERERKMSVSEKTYR
jgi:hypothetical protein